MRTPQGNGVHRARAADARSPDFFGAQVPASQQKHRIPQNVCCGHCVPRNLAHSRAFLQLLGSLNTDSTQLLELGPFEARVRGSRLPKLGGHHDFHGRNHPLGDVSDLRCCIRPRAPRLVRLRRALGAIAPSSRQRSIGRYELFFYPHHMFCVFFAMLLIHGPVFWLWAMLPISMYVFERLMRLVRGNRPVSVNRVEWIKPVLAVQVASDQLPVPSSPPPPPPPATQTQSPCTNPDRSDPTKRRTSRCARGNTSTSTARTSRKTSGTRSPSRPLAGTFTADRVFRSTRARRWCRCQNHTSCRRAPSGRSTAPSRRFDRLAASSRRARPHCERALFRGRAQDWRKLEPDQLLDRHETTYNDFVSVHIKVALETLPRALLDTARRGVGMSCVLSLLRVAIRSTGSTTARRRPGRAS